MSDNIIKNIFELENDIKKYVNKNQKIPQYLLELLNEAKYSINRIHEVTNLYKGIPSEQCQQTN